MMAADSMRPVEILLVEDSPTDRLIAVEALERSHLLNSLNVVENGVDAMAYLRREGKFSAARRPDIILFDLNLPKKGVNFLPKPYALGDLLGMVRRRLNEAPKVDSLPRARSN